MIGPEGMDQAFILRSLAEGAEQALDSMGWDQEPGAMLLNEMERLPGMEDAPLAVGHGLYMGLETPWPWMRLRGKVAPHVSDTVVAMAVGYEHWSLSDARNAHAKQLAVELHGDPEKVDELILDMVTGGKNYGELDDREDERSVYVMNREGDVAIVTRRRSTDATTLREGLNVATDVDIDGVLVRAMKFCLDLA